MSKPWGVYWGSFDPPTLAHHAIIEKILQQLDRLLIVVNDQTWKQSHASLFHRMAMLKGMCQPWLSRIEILRQTDLHECDYFLLKQQFPHRLVAVMGSDSYEAWRARHPKEDLHRYDEIWVIPRHANNLSLQSNPNSKVLIQEISGHFHAVSSGTVREALKKDPFILPEGLDAGVYQYIHNHLLSDYTST